ncbi:DUF5107 domain-containing protein [Bifidobacterium sp. CP2]|uniref:DUF5107 domain-containing protein n=1 Tax=Bifidobacterium sp. CP2 TaxID=2809025 RepID=UPI001BDC90CF|nr:DUF5107 domain-containing protein [Bifidobacterium sp. CP2]MBT1181132.1 DUF5107 domain-containing protein [Bifidobacterium sp. CP2]
MSYNPVTAGVERMIIPTYEPPAPDEMPMYSEFRQHQGSTGYAYPNRVTLGVERDRLTDHEYTVVRLENDYIRLLILPELGGRILEGYDKVNDYNFFYRHHRIKPVIVGSYGNWISGGMEFNFPFHHRPGTWMPVDYSIEKLNDGTVIVWCSEAAPSPGQYRLKGTWGVKLRPDVSYYETVVKIDNRTPVKHPFLWYENAGIHVNANYQLFFPQDVGYVHHHYDRHHATFPITKGWYAVENHEEETDISLHRNTLKGNSYFAAPSKYDFFGGYDHDRDCGTVHVADHHVVPGKKQFMWALEDLGDAWNANLTDNDGEHAELMAGAYSDDQPDFTYIAPYEVKTWSQFWYPIHGTKAPTFANIHGVVTLDKADGEVRVAVTKSVADAVLEVSDGENTVLRESITLDPGNYREFDVALPADVYTLRLTAADGTVLMDYTEDKPDVLRIPEDNPGIPTPHELTTAQEIYVAGEHIDQYRDPSFKGRDYYLVALERDPEHLPSLLAMAEDRYNNALYDEALAYLRRADKVLNRFNHNPYDGTYSYLKALCEYGKGEVDAVYETFFKAAWSNNVISPAMTFIAGIDGQRGDWAKMREHAGQALKKEADHAVCGTYKAIAQIKLGDRETGLAELEDIIARDRLDHLARFAYLYYSGRDLGEFYSILLSNPAQTILDVTFDLLRAGLKDEAVALLEGTTLAGQSTPMTHYTLAFVYDALGRSEAAASNREAVSDSPIVDVFPYRLEELPVLKAAVEADPTDYTAAYLYGCLLYNKLQYQAATDQWRKVTELKPDFHIGWRNLAIAYFSKFDRREEALELMKKAVAAKPKDDTLVRETNYVAAKLGVDGRERLDWLLANLPDKPSDTLAWDLADAYSNVFEFDKALDVLKTHEFVAAECQETYLTESYTFALCCKGRLLERDGKVEEALECYRNAQIVPANFRAGWWDTQQLYYARWFEAAALQKLGREDEARKAASRLLPFIHSNYSPYMGPETDYYVALAERLLGDNIISRKDMSASVVKWEEDARNDLDRKPIVTSLHLSFVPDGVTEHKAETVRALAYSRLFFNDKAGARELFEESLKLNPDNPKARFELHLLELDGE